MDDKARATDQDHSVDAEAHRPSSIIEEKNRDSGVF